MSMSCPGALLAVVSPDSVVGIIRSRIGVAPLLLTERGEHERSCAGPGRGPAGAVRGRFPRPDGAVGLRPDVAGRSSAADGPPVDGDHPDRRCYRWSGRRYHSRWRGAGHQPGRDRSIQGLGVDGLQRAADRRLAGPLRRRPSRARTPTGRSWAHSPIAVNVRAPASTGQTPIASTATRSCRTPRGALGSSTTANAASRSTGTRSRPATTRPERTAATAIGKDGQADTAVAPVIVLV